MRVVRDLHGNDLDVVLAGQFEHPGQAALAVPLEGVGIGAWLVGTHARALLPVLLERLHHGFHVFRRVHGAQPGKHVEVVLAEAHPVVVEIGGPLVVMVAPEHAVLLGDAYHALHAGQAGHVLNLQGSRVANQVDLGQDLLGAFLVMHPALYVFQVGQEFEQLPVLGTILVGVRGQDQNHRVFFLLLLISETLA